MAGDADTVGAGDGATVGAAVAVNAGSSVSAAILAHPAAARRSLLLLVTATLTTQVDGRRIHTTHLLVFARIHRKKLLAMMSSQKA